MPISPFEPCYYGYGVPESLVMLATSHPTYAQFNVYLNLNEQELLTSHQQSSDACPKQAA